MLRSLNEICFNYTVDQLEVVAGFLDRACPGWSHCRRRPSRGLGYSAGSIQRSREKLTLTARSARTATTSTDWQLGQRSTTPACR